MSLLGDLEKMSEWTEIMAAIDHLRWLFTGDRDMKFDDHGKKNIHRIVELAENMPSLDGKREPLSGRSVDLTLFNILLDILRTLSKQELVIWEKFHIQAKDYPEKSFNLTADETSFLNQIMTVWLDTMLSRCRDD